VVTAPTPASTSSRPSTERESHASIEPLPRRVDIDRLLLLFAIAFTVCILAPVFTRGFFPLYPMLPWSSLVDFFTPVILIPLYWLLFASAGAPSGRETLVFLAIASLWVLGHGVHLAANSIGYAMRSLPHSYATDLAHLYDEVLGHCFWHGGVIGLSALITLRSARAEAGVRARVALRVIGALLYGLTYFLVIVEGGTAPIGIPFAAAFVIVSLARSRAALTRSPILGFFFVAHLFASVLFAVWAILHSGLPQFSEVGIID
jgi:hypothetical protein